MQVKDLKWHLILRICLKFPKYKKGRRREERTKLTNLSKCVTPAPHAATKADLSLLLFLEIGRSPFAFSQKLHY